METDSSEHIVFQNDPLKLKEYVNKFVEISKTNGKFSRGTVYTIDPVSESVFLLIKSNGKLSAELVSGHAVSKIQIVDQPSDYEQPDECLFAQKQLELSPKALEKRKLGVKAWLIENRLPVTESGELLIMENSVTITPPYNSENVLSHNEMVLERIQSLIKNMPLNQY